MEVYAWNLFAEWVKQRTSGSSPAGSEGALAAEAAAAVAEPLPGYGGSMRLLTDLPPQRPAPEILLMQVQNRLVLFFVFVFPPKLDGRTPQA